MIYAKIEEAAKLQTIAAYTFIQLDAYTQHQELIFRIGHPLHFLL